MEEKEKMENKKIEKDKNHENEEPEPAKLCLSEKIFGDGTDEQKEELREYAEDVEKWIAKGDDEWDEMYNSLRYAAMQTSEELSDFFMKKEIDPNELWKRVRDNPLTSNSLTKEIRHNFENNRICIVEKTYMNEENIFKILRNVLKEWLAKYIERWPEDEQEQIREKMREVLDNPREPIHYLMLKKMEEQYNDDGNRYWLESVERCYAYQNLRLTRKTKKYWKLKKG